ncbi:uncharacterized protein Z518_06815 [Rhinocladiella mackenziei CBS 650.93]|uniref:Peroxisomal membrane protein PEX14 n=1 Tax=Rhinocladiella mackenziei CBS 650.93 TaxID=1442369 RepID=A0A0D2GYH7_9EURO|nr:uncharacterized protein Z518_06815 [Rhinocladiella mackenziei CBS 650.93]KIX03263.1 hypothetical protein Z518_06815 [Rhinocladiella mackenziei CBS 650.93]
MAPREDLVSSAVTFLQDPSVASAPLDKRIEFLKSKNLTQEEIDLSLARAANDPSQPAPPPNAPSYPSAQQIRGPPGPRYPYPYNPYGEWQPPPPPEPPRRDWRDWFIMATVVGGASYGLYVLAQRYIKPLIAPPTPPQLEQDKAAIDEQFNKAFALLDTLSSDTAALKEAEEARTERLDHAITDIETVVAELKAANMRREDDARRMEAEIKTMKDSLPRSIDSVRDASERQLKELSTELGSLKMLMGNRMGGSSSLGVAGQGIPRTQPGTLPSTNNTAATPSTETGPSSSGSNVNGPRPTPSFTNPTTSHPPSASVPASTAASRPASASAFATSGSKAVIPAWQMAAASKPKDFNIAPATGAPTTNGSANTPQPDGAEAVAALTAS